MSLEEVLDNLGQNLVVFYGEWPTTNAKDFQAVEDFIRIQKKVETGFQLEIDFGTRDPFWEYFKIQNNSFALTRTTSLTMYNIEQRRKSRRLNVQLQRFLDICGATQITHLSLEGLVIPLYSKVMFKLCSSFPNVTNLELKHPQTWDGGYIQGDEDETWKEISIPTFKKLQHLKFTRLRYSPHFGLFPECAETKNAFNFCVKFVQTHMSNLERLSFPFENYWGVDRDQVTRFACMCILSDAKFKLEDVSGFIIEKLLETDNRIPEMGTLALIKQRIDAKVASTNYTFYGSFHQKLQHLEKVEVVFDPFEHFYNDAFYGPAWAHLKEMTVEVSRLDLPDYTIERNFFHNLFDGRVVEKLVKLQISFPEWPVYEFLSTTSISTSCPNLRILHLESKHGLLNLTEFWRALDQLEELKFNRCFHVNNADFVGEDEHNPDFWNLKCLKVLEFNKMDVMDITDELFSKVICHMPLKKLSLHSDRKVDSITLDGIATLCNGQFATTIEKLSLRLSGVSFRKQRRVENLFRSSKII